MPRRPDGRRRGELLDALIDAFGSGGIGVRSLRDIAAAAGTSHRLLLHHFGSRDQMLVAIVEEVERRQTSLVAELPMDAAGAFATMWEDVRRPEHRAAERLFFECYARGAQGEEPFARLVPAAVEGWLDTIDAETNGAADRDLTRLCLAVTRGLLLDLVATGDTTGVDSAAARFTAMLRKR